MRITLTRAELKAEGLEIGIKGFDGDTNAPEDFPSQIYAEVYNGKLQIHVWNGDQRLTLTANTPSLTCRWDNGTRSEHSR